MHKYIRFFCVEKPVETQIYHLSLPISYQIHSVFYVFLLKLYESRGEEEETHISKNITIDEHNEYEIEKILNKKNTKNEL